MTAKFLYTEKHFHSEFLKLKKGSFHFLKNGLDFLLPQANFPPTKKKHFSNDTKSVC